MTEEKIEAVENDEDDVVIIGDVMPKPMAARENKKPNRRVEFKKSKYKKQSLVITQKVKVKRRKYKYIVQQGKKNDTKSTQDSTKKNNKCGNVPSEVIDKCERYAPVCLRKSCQSRCYVEPRSRKSTDRVKKSAGRVKTNRRHRNDFPRDLKRLLSPVSPSPLERDLSFDLSISFDTSSLREDNESKLDTLIKRTRDRDRKNQMTRTHYLLTPPHTEIANEDIVEDVKMTDTISSVVSYKPPYTSTPKYEEKDDKNSSIASNSIIEQSKNKTFLEEVELSPIKKADEVPISQSIYCKDQGSQCSLLEDKNIQNTKSEIPNVDISNRNYDQNVEDTTVSITNKSIKEQMSKSCKDIKIRNKDSHHVQTDMPNINYAHNSFNKLPTSNDAKQSIISQSPFQKNKQTQPSTWEDINIGVSNNTEQNISGNMSISNDKVQINKVCSPYLENTQKKSEYTQTAIFDTNYETDVADTRIIVSNNIVEPINKSSCSEQLQIQHQSCDIDNIVTNTNGLLIDDEKIPLCNDNVPSIEIPLNKDVQNKSTEYRQTASLVCHELKPVNRNTQINHIAQVNTEHTSFFGDVQTPHNQLLDIKKAICEKNIVDNCISISNSKNNIEEQISSQKIKHTNINSNANFEQNTDDIDMSISYDNGDNFAEQPITYSLSYEDAHLQHKQSEYYWHPTVPNTNYEVKNDYNRPNDFCSNSEQIAENNEMSICYNNLIVQHLQEETHVLAHGYYELNNNVTQQPRSVFHPFDENIFAQDIKYDTYSGTNSANQKNYDGEKAFFSNYSEQPNRNCSPHKQFGNYSDSSDIQHGQNKYRNISISNDSNSNEQQNGPIYEDRNNTSKLPDNTFTDYSYKTYEQFRNESKPMFYDNNFKEQRNNRHSPNFETFAQHNRNEYNYSAYSNRKQEQIRNMSFLHDDNREHQHISQRAFSKNLHEQQMKSDYIRTSYSNKNYNRNIDHKIFNNPAQQRNSFIKGAHLQHKKYKFSHNDGFKKTNERNITDRDIPNSYKNNNFQEKPFKRNSPFSYDPRNKKSKFMHAHHSNEYYKQRIEEQEVSIANKNSYYKDRRNSGCNEGVEDRLYLQHRKYTYNEFSKKKVDIIIDKRMSDEAYEDVLVGIHPGGFHRI